MFGATRRGQLGDDFCRRPGIAGRRAAHDGRVVTVQRQAQHVLFQFMVVLDVAFLCAVLDFVQWRLRDINVT